MTLRAFIHEWLWDAKTFSEYMGWGFGAALAFLSFFGIAHWVFGAFPCVKP